ncbi:MAG: acyltransferase [Bacteroidetes bacterium]|nr:acyltransferase [Bacteroidota bacterium]
MNRLISQKFRFYSFICIALLLFVHGYNLKETYLTPASLVDEPITFAGYFEYFISNGLLRFRIPMLFMISGYIFSLQDYKPYAERAKKRFVTLMIPYFIWGAIGIGITWLWQQNEIMAQAVQQSKVDQFGVNKPYAELGWIEVLKRWLIAPPSYQLWFIRNLFVYNLLYPVFRWIVTKYPIPWFSIMFILMVMIFQLYIIDAQGMFFFTAGIWLNKTHFPLDKKPIWFSAYLYWLIFIGIVVIKTFMAFEFESHNFVTYWTMMLMHFIAVMAGVVAVWYSGDAVVKWFMHRKWFLWATSFSFIIFGLHVPLLNYVMSLSHMYLHNIPNYRLISFLVIPLLMILFCIEVGALLRKLLPGWYRIATGGRGI